MQESDELNPGDREFESALAGVALADTKLRRDELTYALGRASVTHRLNAWRCVCIALMAVTLISLTIPLRPPAAFEKSPDTGKPQPDLRPSDPPSTRKAVYLSARTALLDDEVAELDGFFAPFESSVPALSNSDSVRSLRRELLN